MRPRPGGPSADTLCATGQRIAPTPRIVNSPVRPASFLISVLFIFLRALAVRGTVAAGAVIPTAAIRTEAMDATRTTVRTTYAYPGTTTTSKSTSAQKAHLVAKAVEPEARRLAALPGAAPSELVRLINPLGNEPLGCVINRRRRVLFGLWA